MTAPTTADRAREALRDVVGFRHEADYVQTLVRMQGRVNDVLNALSDANLAIVDAGEYRALRDVLDAKARCTHPDAYASWECEACFEEAMQHFIQTERERAEREGRVKHFRLVPVEQQGGQGE